MAKPKKEIRKTDKGYLVKYAGTKGQTYYGKSKKDAPFFDFKVVDNLKRAAKNLGMDIK